MSAEFPCLDPKYLLVKGTLTIAFQIDHQDLTAKAKVLGLA